MADTLTLSQSGNRGPTPAQWEAQKENIRRLYRVRNMTHKELAEEMTKIFGCRITAKMCKDRTTKWGFAKSIKKREYETIIEQQAKGEQNRQIWVRGKQVKQRDIDRYLKRRKIEDSPAHRYVDSAASVPQPTPEITNSGRSLISSNVTLSDPDDHPPDSSMWSMTEDTATECAQAQRAALGNSLAIVDTTGALYATEQNEHENFLSLNSPSPQEPLASLLTTPSWPTSPAFRLLLQEGLEESELSFADSVNRMESILNDTHTTQVMDKAQEKAINPPLAGSSLRIEEHLPQPSMPPGSEEVSDVASRWISVCSLASLQHSYGKIEIMRHALYEANKLFDEMIRTSDRQLLSSIVVFGAILEAHGKDNSVETLLSHTLVTSSNILGPRHAITVTIAWIVDVLSKKEPKARIRVSVSKLREISYEFEKDHGKLHPYYVTSVFNLAKALDLDNYADEAEPLLREIVEICPRIFARGHPQSIIAQMNLARLISKRGQFVEARFLMDSAVSSSEERWGSSHPYTLECLRRQAIMLESLESPERIEELLKRVL
ncbi:hypothetical protein EPUS_05195 [Endocarpon pusillum Z07020]|uniref:Clr5 domain-containing protein n=1 Tax=Endocarpon pusillum (strain Z07020 / HMAS-L-300199) TaxID=1263415 RepID=U1GF60_ENDPU|nr:uncharacterized protein EPUS_05195 [Endocarpon pusillum Z07020]ERF70376.1 hypothetical protein EPUS_05195 [Endocarpon pusillum Z07020]